MTDQPRTPDGCYGPVPEPRDVAVLIRCTRAERERWREQAHAEGIAVSELVRRLLDA